MAHSHLQKNAKGALFEEEASVAVAEEAEVVGEGVVVDRAPMGFAHKSRHQEQQGALWLVKIGNHPAHDAIGEAGSNHQLGATHVGVGMVTVEIGDNILQSLFYRNLARRGVGHPLCDGEHLIGGIGMAFQHLPHIVEALQRAHTRGAHRHHRRLGFSQFSEQTAAHGYELVVHLVVANAIAFHGLKSTGSHMQGEFAPLNVACIALCEHLVGEMQSGSGCCHTAIDMAIDGLIICRVGGFGGSIQIGRNGDFADGL